MKKANSSEENMIDIYLEKLKNEFDSDIYNMLHKMDHDYNGFINHAHGLSKEDYMLWINNI
ncbi:MAG: hypothetical protein N2749_04985 [Clostridia bacterium]|nr:hypothetical protein [Clostridia bacterium]